MASTLKRNSTVDDAEYNNFIRDFAAYYKKYQAAIKQIVKDISGTVMVQNIWTDQYAADFALWFNDESGVSDGCDKLNKALAKMEALFKTTCYAPIKDVVKLIGKDSLSKCPMMKKSYNAKDIYAVLGVTKYRKSNFGRLNLKRKSGWKAVTNAAKINQLVSSIEKNIKIAKDIESKIQKLVKKKVLTPGDRCIEITNFNNTQLTKIISEINTALTKFETKSTKMANTAISELDTTMQKVVTKITTIEGEPGQVIEDTGTIVKDK
ncbi:MAG: hypothetical protein HFJ59_07285 [Clostridia bacterium]|nr:hypothetical protein [Clostridia bacterium]